MNPASIENISDKVYWHQFDEFYFSHVDIEPKNILEIGVASGYSIRLLRDKYPRARIFGFDIIDQPDSWPVDANIFYHKIDQGDAAGFRTLMTEINVKFDLVIEDGSHDPLHQKISLLQCLDFIREGGIYILEDLHTSHVHHSFYIQRGLKSFAKPRKWFEFYKKPAQFHRYFGPLHCLLLLDFHLRKNLRKVDSCGIDFDRSLFSLSEIERLLNRVRSIEFFKRLRLPYYCYNCKTANFDFARLRCECGADLYSETDSMTSLIRL